MKKSGVILIIVLAVLLAGSIMFQFRDVFSEPTAKKLTLFTPKGEMPDPEKILSSSNNVFTVLLHQGGKIYSYYGNKISEGNRSNLYDSSFQKSLIEANEKYKDQLYVYLKPAEAATYKNTIDLLDQMLINNISKYAMVDLFDIEKKIIDNFIK